MTNGEIKKKILEIIKRLGTDNPVFTFGQLHSALGDAGLTHPFIYDAQVKQELEKILLDENVVVQLDSPGQPYYRLP